LAWAADKATFDQLRNLSEADGQYSIDDDLEAAALVYIVMENLTECGPADAPAEEVGQLCDDIGVDRESNDAISSKFWQGFVEASIEVFEQV
jgi:hypothetical protein